MLFYAHEFCVFLIVAEIENFKNDILHSVFSKTEHGVIRIGFGTEWNLHTDFAFTASGLCIYACTP